MNVKTIQLITGFILLLSIEILDLYFPAGTARPGAVEFVIENINYLRIIGFLMIFYPVIYYYKFGNATAKFAVSGALLVYVMIAFLTR